jgi:transcriptional regulator with XRE-family HTH domain
MRAIDPEALARLRASRDSLPEFAHHAGVGEATVSRAERGEKITKTSAESIARALDQRTEDLFTREATVALPETRLDARLFGSGRERVEGNLPHALGPRTTLSLSTDPVLHAQMHQRIVALIMDERLYRRDYQMDFDLKPTRGGVRINIGLEFELVNTTEENHPYFQEFTINHHENGHAKEMSALKNGKPIYILKDPSPYKSTDYKSTEGYAVYRGPKLIIEPKNSGVQYVFRSSWVINRKKHDLWSEALALPTVGVSVNTHAPPEYVITRSFSRPDLMLRDEHFNISWEPKK